MKWQAKNCSFDSKSYEIKYDLRAGFYLYVFEEGKCVSDYLQDTLELAMECALEDFGVPKEAWEKVKD